MNNPRLNKGTAFSERERRMLGLEGLLPPGVSTLQMQAQRNYESIMAKPDPLERYIGLVALQASEELALTVETQEGLQKVDVEEFGKAESGGPEGEISGERVSDF